MGMVWIGMQGGIFKHYNEFYSLHAALHHLFTKKYNEL